jgi:DNA-binding transcriptional LysR family regulator
MRCSPSVYCDAARLGIGIAQVSVHHAWQGLRSGQIKIVLANEYLSSQREIVLQYPHRAYTASRIKVFVEHVVASMQADIDLQFNTKQLIKFTVS